MNKITDFMQQAKNMQKKMSEFRENLNNIEAMGESGGGLVKVTLDGNGRVKKLFIDSSLKSSSQTGIEVLEDLLIAAINNARDKLTEIINREISGGFDLSSLGFK